MSEIRPGIGLPGRHATDAARAPTSGIGAEVSGAAHAITLSASPAGQTAILPPSTGSRAPCTKLAAARVPPPPIASRRPV